MRTKFFKSGYVLIAAIVLLFAAADAVAGEYRAMQGVETTDTVFDFRIGDPALALGHLNLIHTMKDDPGMVKNGAQPDIVLVFIGPSVKLVSTDRSGFDAQARKTLDKLSDKISGMKKDGIRFEICMHAVAAYGVDPETIMPEIEKVKNGWVSLVGYQQKGYAVIADFN